MKRNKDAAEAIETVEAQNLITKFKLEKDGEVELRRKTKITVIESLDVSEEVKEPVIETGNDKIDFNPTYN